MAFTSCGKNNPQEQKTEEQDGGGRWKKNYTQCIAMLYSCFPHNTCAILQLLEHKTRTAAAAWQVNVAITSFASFFFFFKKVLLKQNQVVFLKGSCNSEQLSSPVTKLKPQLQPHNFKKYEKAIQHVLPHCHIVGP